MRIIDLGTVAVIAVVIFILSATVCTAEDVRTNPHSETGECAICHVAPVNRLRSWFTSDTIKKELKYDLNQVCLKCHTVDPTHAGSSLGIGIGHATGKKTAVNSQNLPLASDGTITCATTCHNIHVTTEDGRQQQKYLRLPVNSLCISCHDK